MPPIPDHSLPAAWLAIEALQAQLAQRDAMLQALLSQNPPPINWVAQVARAAKGEAPIAP